MAMSASSLKTEIKNAIKTEMSNKGFDIDNAATGGQADDYIDALAKGIADAVVTHITTNAQAVDVGTVLNPAGNWPII